ncbi:hypothetical protein CCZ20_25570 [Priestia aryabhattai]|uniref:putative phage abortive infection protein n=1 Tax=Priestia aryabhattai TaxID=412384 RepID=UPI000B50C5A3|nr:putative phage abortive infection protein [Priestia aryabhattai]OVE34654.1 hypothetical protein CCZ20_25570 [Priestia aryabhattai]
MNSQKAIKEQEESTNSSEENEKIEQIFSVNEEKIENRDLEYKAKSYTEYAWFLASVTIMVPFMGFLFVKVFKINFSDLGPYGDFIAGSTVPLLTFASFILLAATLITQQIQMNMQREELKLTREEYARTNEELDEQNKNLLLQRFEVTFFNILSSHNEVMDSNRSQFEKIYHTLKEKAKVERETYEFYDKRYFYNVEGLVAWFDSLPEGFIGSLKENNLGERAESSLAYCKENDSKIKEFLSSYETLEFKYMIVNRVYEELYDDYHYILGHYFRSLHRIVKYVHRSDVINEEEKKFYLGIVRSQLSSYEHIFLFYNCLSSYGCKDFLPMIKKYDLLDEMKVELMINSDIFNHYTLYEEFHSINRGKANSLSEIFDGSFIERWKFNLNILYLYRKEFQPRIQEVMTTYLNSQLVVADELINDILKGNIGVSSIEIQQEITLFLKEMKDFKKEQIQKINNNLNVSYLSMLKEECKEIIDKAFRICKTNKAAR